MNNNNDNAKKLLPITISDYKTLRENNYYYVDKTLLIQDIYKPGQVILVTRPRRFGKTLNLSMLRYFFEKSEAKSDHLFIDTAIWRQAQFRSLQGQYPVIFVTFKNIKIKQMFQESLIDAEIEDFLLAIIEGETATFNALLQSFIMKSMSYFDIPNTEPEKSYHLFVLGLFAALGGKYLVKSNRESGIGRYDIMLIPKHLDNPAVVIEFKKVMPEETLESAVQKAIDQIIEKKYIQELHDLNFRTIRGYGIAFEGKNVLVKALDSSQVSIL